MSQQPPPIPVGFHTITPYLYVADAPEAIAFYTRAFGAKERYRLTDPDGKVRHAELFVGDSPLFVTDVPIDPDMQIPGPNATSPVWLYLYVEDPDSLFDRAVAAGADPVTLMGDQAWGDRYGAVADPFGYRWGIARRRENLSREELTRRMRATYHED
jgi:uncharacterized glyoxalase superfamily protein PhnB